MTSATSFSTTLFHANITVSIREFVAIIFHDFDYGVSGLELAWVPRVPGTCRIFGQHCPNISATPIGQMGLEMG
jgi:hypothetical protein